jgi:hypothetical protein
MIEGQLAAQREQKPQLRYCNLLFQLSPMSIDPTLAGVNRSRYP